jgi:hypothetical protein
MSSPQAAPGAAVLSPLRAAASRRNGAKSCGPKAAEGKARSAQNALKHGFRAQKHVVLPDEDAAEFAVLEAALLEELAPGPVGGRGPNPFPALARRRARSSACWRSASSPRPGGSSGRSASRPSCSPRTSLRAGAWGTP